MTQQELPRQPASPAPATDTGSARSSLWPRLAQTALTILVLLAGVAAARAMVAARRPVESVPARTAVRVVRVQTIERRPLVHDVRTHGTVVPRAETTLVAEVSGRIVATTPAFVTGGSLATDQLLLEIDPSTYEVNRASARASLARASAILLREEAESRLARSEWERFGEGDPSPLVLREPQLEEARAGVQSAEVALRRAELDLQRTGVRSPYAGRIRERYVEQGQYVTLGTPVAVIYATDYAEIRLPVSPSELAYLDLPLAGGSLGPEEGPSVTLQATMGGVRRRWRAWITRTEAEIDARTRSLHAVARIADPYGVDGGSRHSPLLVGTFVEAIIQGRAAGDAAEIPRHAVVDEHVWIVDDAERLQRRHVTVLQLGTESAWIGNGLQDGDRLCVTELDVAVDGMKVNIFQPLVDGAQ